jgi:cyclopropane fatty-acyl-phospholipid synthase-like methyltransferase
MQLERSRFLDITEPVYFEIIRQKTASLIASCCAIGAASAGAEKDLTDRFHAFGEKIGIAFQIRDDLFERYLRSTDFIQQYIFPGGVLPSPEAFRAQARRAGLVVERELAFGPDYAETLRRWRTAFLARDAQVRRLGFDTRFMRIWEFYLAYCEAAFDTGNTDVVQFTLRHA